MAKKITNYRKAWIDYRKSDDFKRSDNALKTVCLAPRYRRSILMSAFAAGWNATGKKIKFIT